MRFRTVLMAVFCSFLLVLSASLLLVVFRLFDRYTATIESPAIPRALDTAIETYRDTDLTERERTERIMESVLAVRQAYGRLGVEKKAWMIGSLVAFLAFLTGQVAAMVALSYLVARLLTRPLAQIRAGCERIESGDRVYRFPTFSGHELRLVGARLNAMLDTAAENEALMAEQSRLLGWQEVASFLAHQIKNPLAALSLAARNVELAMGHPDRAEIVAESLAVFSHEPRRVSDLIERFRDAARFPELRREPTDLAEIIRSAAERMPADRADFRLHLQGGLTLSVDRELLRETLVNLFTNSVEAGDGHAVIDVGLSRHGATCIITVDDDARNVSQDIAHHVLQGAFTTKPGGSGMGLLFVRKVVALHGGAISAHRASDGGLVFEVRLRG